ncbi:MAG: PHP domain-containing protein [Bacillota bacterium]
MEFLPPQPHFTAAATPDGRGCLVVPRFITVFQPSPKEIRIPVIAVNMSPGTGVRLLEITISDKSGKERARLAPNAAHRSVADVAPTKEKLPLLLDQPENPDLVPLLKKSYLNPEVIVPVEDLVTGEGGAFTLLTTATFQTGKAKHTATAETLVVVTALPSRPNWYAGDGHIHSTWSDGDESISQRVSKMKNAGFKWIIITDHEDKMREKGGWQPYVCACNSTQSSCGIVVAPGAEIGCVQTQGDQNSAELGHALGYRLKESATSIPQNKYYTPQNLINAINSHNSPYSYAVIAHPYRSVKWQNWSVTGFRAMELLSYERTASSSTISKWVQSSRRTCPTPSPVRGLSWVSVIQTITIRG